MSITTTKTSTFGSVTAVDDTLSATQDTLVTYASSQILGNDIFVGFPSADLSIAFVTSVNGGAVVLNPDGSVTFTPNDDFSGVASFVYVATYTTPRLIDVTSLVPSEGAVLQGQAGDYAGWSVSSAGDVNGDGFSDLIVGEANSTGTTGEAFVLLGKASGFGTVNGAGTAVVNLGNLSLSDGFAIEGGTPSELAGLSVSSAGDINHDGFADLIIGAPQANDGGGAAFVVFGHAVGFGTMDLGSLSPAQGFEGFVAEPDDRAGWTV